MLLLFHATCVCIFLPHVALIIFILQLLILTTFASSITPFLVPSITTSSARCVLKLPTTFLTPPLIPTLQLSPTASDDVDDLEVYIYGLIEEGAWDEGVDAEKAKKMIDDTFNQVSVLDSMSGINTEKVSIDDFDSLDSCESALFDLAVEVIGLVMAHLGLSGRIGKKAASAIFNKAGENLLKKTKRIAKERFQ